MPEQDVTQRGQVRCCRERQGRGTSPPASSSVSSAAKYSSAKMTSQRSTHSGSSKEAAAIASPHCLGGALVGREKHALVADSRREPVQALPHGGDRKRAGWGRGDMLGGRRA